MAADKLWNSTSQVVNLICDPIMSWDSVRTCTAHNPADSNYTEKWKPRSLGVLIVSDASCETSVDYQWKIK